MKTKENLKSFSLTLSAVAFVAIATESNGNSSLEHFPADTVAVSSSGLFPVSTAQPAEPKTSGVEYIRNLISNKATAKSFITSASTEIKQIEEEEEHQDLVSVFEQVPEAAEWFNAWASNSGTYLYDPETRQFIFSYGGTNMGSDSSSITVSFDSSSNSFSVIGVSNGSDNFLTTTNNPNNYPSPS